MILSIGFVAGQEVEGMTNSRLDCSPPPWDEHQEIFLLVSVARIRLRWKDLKTFALPRRRTP